MYIDEPIITCEICEYGFYESRILEIINIHGVKFKVCDICEDEFKKFTNMNKICEEKNGDKI